MLHVRRPRSEEIVMDDVGRRIGELRRKKKWPQASLAEALGLPIQNVARLEQGNHRPNLSTLVAVALALGADVSALFEEPESRAPRRPGRPRTAPTSATNAPAKRGALARAAKR